MSKFVPLGRKAANQPKNLKCPGCGGDLKLLSGDDAELIVCRYCSSRIDLTREPFKVLGKLVLNSDPKDPIQIGMRAKLGGAQWVVIGRLRYRDISPD